jgi:hypothetical protein
MSKRKDWYAIIGMLAMLIGIVGTAWFLITALYHVIGGSKASQSLLYAAYSLGGVLLGSFLMERGEVDPTPNKRDKIE